MTTGDDSFPRQYARTQRLTLGEPRTFTVSPDGSTVLFLRSRGGDDPVNMLWLLDVASGTETLVLDPRSMTIEGEDSAEEARHELADGAEQRARFERDHAVRRSRGADLPAIDDALLDALDAGFPDCAGVALGVDRLMMAMLGTGRIADVVAFDFGRA